MTELEKIFLTSGLTVVGGSLVFAIQRFVLDPLYEQSKVLGRITFAIYYYGREIGRPTRNTADAEESKRYREAADKMRELAGLLAETSQSVRLYWICLLLGGTRRRKHIDDAIGLLTRLSHRLANDNDLTPRHSTQSGDDADEVLKRLHLRKWGK